MRTLPALQDDDVLVRNVWMSIDPNMRIRLAATANASAALKPGDVMTGGAVGIVEQTRSPSLPAGTLVFSQFGWRERFVAPAGKVRPLEKSQESPRLYLGILGMPGIAAYAGIEIVLQPRAGEIVLVSGAAGAVGMIACQLAKARGARVLGTAGSQPKLAWLREIGVDAALNYRTDSIAEFLKREAPGGLDVYFDNVGGTTLDAALVAMKRLGRIGACGAISQYESEDYRRGPAQFFRIVEKSLHVQGFAWSDFAGSAQSIVGDLRARLASGAIKWREHELRGLESAPSALVSLYDGSNVGVGKLIVRLSDS
jgi:NADPH-dependent curcumin reductase CurA